MELMFLAAYWPHVRYQIKACLTHIRFLFANVALGVHLERFWLIYIISFYIGNLVVARSVFLYHVLVLGQSASMSSSVLRFPKMFGIPAPEFRFTLEISQVSDNTKLPLKSSIYILLQLCRHGDIKKTSQLKHLTAIQ